MGLSALKRVTINVPLFVADYDFAPINGFHGLGVFVNFDPNSTDAYRPVSDAIAYPAKVNRMGSELISVHGLSRAEVNPTSGVAATAIPSYIDGKRVSFQSAQTVGTTVFTSWFIKRQNPKPASYGITPLKSFQTFGNRRSQLTCGPVLSNLTGKNIPVIGGLWTDLSFGLNVSVTNYNGTFVDLPGTFNGVNTANLAANQGIHARIPYPSPFDNSIFFPAHGGTHPSKSIFLFSSLGIDAGAYVDNIGFDDPTLDTPFQADLYSVFSTPFGFMFGIVTGGAGPTGNPQEIILVRPDWSSYSVINPIPQSDQVKNAIAGVAPQAWQIMIDSLGILWFNPGSNAEVVNLYTSYSPLPPIPTLYFPPLPPFVLPCEDFCPPLT